MLRISIIILALLCTFSMPGQAEENADIRGIRTFLDSGKPDLAASAATRLLRKSDLSRSDRGTLLAIIVEAEIQQVTASHFSDVKPAIAAIDSLLREFPDSEYASDVRWRRAWLFWKGGHHNQAIMAAREITTIDQQPENLRRAWLLMARIHISLENYSYARSDLLQYGLQVKKNSREQALGMAWMSIVDFGEKRNAIAYKQLNKVYAHWPDTIEKEPDLFATYIQLMVAEDGQRQQAFKLSKRFIKRFIDRDQAPPIRLIHADILASQPASIKQAIKEYSILSQSYAETVVGRKAFIRKLMLDNRDVSDREALLPAMISLKKIADTNQLSVIEDEALLSLARLWARIDTIADDANRDKPQQHSPTLEAYARAALSKDPGIVKAARQEGAAWLGITLEALLNQQQWLKAVTLWRRYPQLQPAPAASQELRLSIAHAQRSLMLFTPAEEMLDQLYRDNLANIRGQRVMLELANLWRDRQDTDGVEKVMGWLNQNEYTIYRPELMVIVARMQLNQKQEEAARQTLKSIRVADVSPESRASYWRTSAEVFDALKQWHSAASAWASYRKSKTADSEVGLNRQALSLFNGKEFAQALTLYLQMPEDKRGNNWKYHVGVCEMRSGQLDQGLNRLQQLVASGSQDTWVELARLALADHQANKLMGMKP